jgi:hypothetical protein
MSVMKSLLSRDSIADTAPSSASPVILNDCHSALNETRAAELLKPDSETGVGRIVREANRRDLALAICGGRHAMGGSNSAGTLW